MDDITALEVAVTTAEILQENYNNLWQQHQRLIKQAREMSAMLKLASQGVDVSAQAGDWLARCNEEIQF